MNEFELEILSFNSNFYWLFRKDKKLFQKRQKKFSEKDKNWYKNFDLKLNAKRSLKLLWFNILDSCAVSFIFDHALFFFLLIKSFNETSFWVFVRSSIIFVLVFYFLATLSAFLCHAFVLFYFSCVRGVWFGFYLCNSFFILQNN